MAVYVDDMRAPYGRMVMCHMLADTDAELHAMADRIGVSRRWHQKAGTHHSHYDISLSKRAQAVAAGAIEITMRDTGRIVRHGHLHWAIPKLDRTLLSGRKMAVQEKPVNLPIHSKTPEKWVAIDLETGDVWAGSLSGWKRAGAEPRQESLAILRIRD